MKSFLDLDIGSCNRLREISKTKLKQAVDNFILLPNSFGPSPSFLALSLIQIILIISEIKFSYSETHTYLKHKIINVHAPNI